MDQFPIMGVPDGGDTAWMLVSSALVLLMTPGLAFFYGGMVRSKSVLNMIMMSISAMGVVTVLWALYGYSIAFGDDVGNIAGNPSQYWGLKGLIGVNAVAADPSTQTAAVNIPLAGTLPATVFVAFQLMFRDHHGCADLRGGGRPVEVRRLAVVRRFVGDVRLFPGRTLGLRI